MRHKNTIDFRCQNCGRKLAGKVYPGSDFEIKCRVCKHLNRIRYVTPENPSAGKLQTAR